MKYTLEPKQPTNYFGKIPWTKPLPWTPKTEVEEFNYGCDICGEPAHMKLETQYNPPKFSCRRDRDIVATEMKLIYLNRSENHPFWRKYRSDAEEFAYNPQRGKNPRWKIEGC